MHESLSLECEFYIPFFMLITMQWGEVFKVVELARVLDQRTRSVATSATLLKK